MNLKMGAKGTESLNDRESLSYQNRMYQSNDEVYMAQNMTMVSRYSEALTHREQSLWDRFTSWVKKKMGVSHKELLASSDVTIVTKKKLRIYAYLNLIAYLLELTTIFITQFVDQITPV